MKNYLSKGQGTTVEDIIVKTKSCDRHPKRVAIRNDGHFKIAIFQYGP